MRFLAQGGDPRRIVPAVKEIEERANGEGIVDGLIVPARRNEGLHIFGANLMRARVDFLHEPQKQSFGFVNGRGLRIAQHRGNQILASQQFRRDRGVRLGSERAVIESRCVRGDHLAQAGRQWRRSAHQRVGHSLQMFGHVGTKGKQMPNTRHFNAAPLCRRNQSWIRSLAARQFFHFTQEHGYCDIPRAVMRHTDST